MTNNNILSEHIITEVNGGIIRNKWPRLLGRNGKVGVHGYGCNIPVITVKTNTGFKGWGVGTIDRTLKLYLEGRKVSEVFDPGIGVLGKFLYAADFALHDLAGKIMNIPVSKMVNTDSGMKISCYDGAVYMNDITPDGDLGVEEILRNCKDDFEKGYTDFKVKIGRCKWIGEKDGLKRDIDVVRAIRKEYPNSKILVDGNDALTVDLTIKFMEGVKDCSIFWIEEAFRENYDDCMHLKEYLAKNSPETLIADGEAGYNLDEILDLAKKGAVDCLIMDPESYGFTGWRKTIAECEGTNIKCSPHCWGTSAKTYSIGHLAAAYPHICPTIEGAVDTVEGVDASGFEMKNGILHIPEKAGFGMELEFSKFVDVYRPY